MDPLPLKQKHHSAERNVNNWCDYRLIDEIFHNINLFHCYE